MPSTSIYCVADKRHFIGAVALVNSLRISGHRQPIYILDCGLDAAQQELLAGEATIVEGQESTAPHLLKWIAPLRHPADLMVLADADIIVVRSLDPVLEQAAAGNVVAFCDALASRHDAVLGGATRSPSSAPTGICEQRVGRVPAGARERASWRI